MFNPLALIISLVLFIYLILDKELHTYLFLGFIPVKKPQKSRSIPPDQLWISLISILATILIIHLHGVLLIGILCTPCILIFSSLLFHKSEKNF